MSRIFKGSNNRIRKLFLISDVPTKGPRQSPIHLSVPMHIIRVLSFINWERYSESAKDALLSR